MGNRKQEAEKLKPLIVPRADLDEFRGRDPLELSGFDLQAIAREVCIWVAEGGNLHDICAEFGLLRRTVFAAINSTEDTLREYGLARIIAADFIASEVLTIADDATDDELHNDKGQVKLNKEFVERAKLRIAARQWYLKHLDPDRYGDRVKLNADVQNSIKIEQITGVTILPPTHGASI